MGTLPDVVDVALNLVNRGSSCESDLNRVEEGLSHVVVVNLSQNSLRVNNLLGIYSLNSKRIGTITRRAAMRTMVSFIVDDNLIYIN
jgi:hypothetical protein